VTNQTLPRRALMAATIAGIAGQAIADDPLVTAVYGDSQAQGLAGGLIRQLRGTQRYRIVNHTKPGSALGTPAIYDWVDTVQKAAPLDRAAFAVLMFGGNDRVPGKPLDGRSLPFRGADWLTFYRQRVAAILHELTAAKTKAVWIGNPVTRDQIYSRDMAYLNEIYRAEIAGEPSALFLDINAAVVDAKGEYQSHGPDVAGVTQRLRTDDGIHFTMQGYDKIARLILGRLATLEPPA
jgi:hypothetical protein